MTGASVLLQVRETTGDSQTLDYKCTITVLIAIIVASSTVVYGETKNLSFKWLFKCTVCPCHSKTHLYRLTGLFCGYVSSLTRQLFKHWPPRSTLQRTIACAYSYGPINTLQLFLTAGVMSTSGSTWQATKRQRIAPPSAIPRAKYIYIHAQSENKPVTWGSLNGTC